VSPSLSRTVFTIRQAWTGDNHIRERLRRFLCIRISVLYIPYMAIHSVILTRAKAVFGGRVDAFDDAV
jgi:hypothetical protein